MRVPIRLFAYLHSSVVSAYLWIILEKSTRRQLPIGDSTMDLAGRRQLKGQLHTQDHHLTYLASRRSPDGIHCPRIRAMTTIQLSLIFLGLCLWGCATAHSTAGRDFDSAKVSQIVKGKTTADEIITMFGTPYSKHRTQMTRSDGYIPIALPPPTHKSACSEGPTSQRRGIKRISISSSTRTRLL